VFWLTVLVGEEDGSEETVAEAVVVLA